MKIEIFKSNTKKPQKKRSVAFRLNETGDRQVALELVDAETGAHLSWILGIKDTGLKLYSWCSPNTGLYDISKDFFDESEIVNVSL